MDLSRPFLARESLPLPLTPLIGRVREIEEVTVLIRRSEVRLVTLTGPGGVGKTRLSVAIASSLTHEFPDGIVFVALAAINESHLVASAIAGALGLRDGATQSLSILATNLRDKRVMLLLDNFEQVVSAAAVVTDLLASCPLLTIIITSREPLKVQGEREYLVAPLPLPDNSTNGDRATSDVVRLFAERAEAVVPEFRLSAENVNTIFEICRRVDGLPLAIELAAARSKTLSPAALLARLDHRLPMLSGNRRDVPTRQQTMRNAIAWSFELLLPDDQVLMGRLAVFVGGFTLDAAELVVTDAAGSSVELLDGIASLVDKSLVQRTSRADATPRFGMLETIREFSFEQLVARDDGNATRDAHARWCTTLAEDWRRYGDTRHEPGMAGKFEPPLGIEYDNVRAALVWLDTSGNLPGLARLAGALWWFWSAHGDRSDAIRWLRRAQGSPDDTTERRITRLWVLQGLTMHAVGRGAHDEARGTVTECLALSRRLGDRLSEASALGWTGYVELTSGNYVKALPFFEEAIALNQQIGHWRAAATTRNCLGVAAYGIGQLELAATHIESALAVHRTSGDKFDIAWELDTLALVRCDQGEPREAASLLTEALAIWLDYSGPENITEWLAVVATLAAATGPDEVGVQILAAAHALREPVGYSFSCPERPRYERTELQLRSALGNNEFDAAWQLGRVMSLHDAVDAASAVLDRISGATAAADLHEEPKSFGLTAREIDVLRHLVQGRTDREIASALFIGPRTVETHVSNLLGKLGVQNRAEATAFAHRNGLI